MGAKGRRTFTDSFKADAIKLALAGNKTIRQIARDLDVDPGTLHTWIRERKQRPADTSAKPPAATPLEEELRRVRKELERVTEERDILKKAAAYFARESK
ncbi:MAG: transposase [Gemmatimonadaceae bacterium]